MSADTNEKIDDATLSMMKAREQYELAIASMKDLEAERSKIVGAPWDTGRMMGIAQKAMPLIVKYGSVLVGGGGLAALMSDPGAFKGLLANLTGFLGGG